MKNKDYSKLEAELCEGYKDLLSGVKYELPAQPRMKKKERSGAGAKIIYAVLSAAALAAVIIGLSAVANYMKNYQPPAGKADTSAVAEKTDTATEADTVKRTEEQTEAHTDDHNGAADTVYIEEYWSGRELPDDTEKALRMIYDESAALCTSGKKILIKRPSAAKNGSGEVLRTLEKRYSYRNLSNMTAVRGLHPDDYIYNEEYFYVLNSKSIYDIYFVFIASVETFTEYYVDADPNYSYHLDRRQFTYLKFSSEFKKAGYASLDEYLKEKPYGCMFVSYVGSGIFGYSDDGVKNKKIDLFGWYADNVPDAASVAESIDVTVISPTGDEYKYGDEVYINVNVKNVSDAPILFVPSDYGLRIRMSPEYGGMFVPDEFVETVPSHSVDYLDPGESFVVTLKVTLADSLWLGPYGLEVEYPGGGKYTSNVFSIVLIESEAQEPFIPSAHSVEECIDRYVTSAKERTAIYTNLKNERGTEALDYIINHYFTETDTYKRALMSMLFYEAVENDGYFTERLIDPFSLWDLISADGGSGRITSGTMFDHAEKAAAILQGYTELAEEAAKNLQKCQIETDHPLTYKLLCAVGFDGYKPGGPDAAFYARGAIKAAAELFYAVRYGNPPAELYKEPGGNNYSYEIPLEDFYAYFEKYIERDIIDKAVRNSEALQLKDGIIVLFELGPQTGVSVMYRESYLTEQSGDTAVISTPILLPWGMYSWEKEMTFEVKRYGDGYRVSGGTFADLMLSPALDAAYSVSYVLGTYLILREGQTEYDSITNNLISDLKMSIDDVREEYRSYLREGAVFPVSNLIRIDGKDEWLRTYASDEIFAALRKETDVFDGRYFVYPYYAKTKTTPDFDHGFRIRVDTDYYHECYMTLYDTLFAMNVIECSKDRVLLSLDFIREENGVKKNVTYTFEVRYGVNDPYAATLTGGTFVTDVILAE